MTTKRETILAAVRSALTGTTGVGTRIWRSRVEPIAREESPAIVVEPVSDTPAQNTSLPTLDWSLLVRITVIARGTIPDQLADPVVEDMHSRLMADLSLGGLAIDIQPGPVSFVLTEADGAAAELQCIYRVQYRTSVSNLGS